jgi:hypothetical protein
MLLDLRSLWEPSGGPRVVVLDAGAGSFALNGQNVDFEIISEVIASGGVFPEPKRFPYASVLFMYWGRGGVVVGGSATVRFDRRPKPEIVVPPQVFRNEPPLRIPATVATVAYGGLDAGGSARFAVHTHREFSFVGCGGIDIQGTGRIVGIVDSLSEEELFVLLEVA